MSASDSPVPIDPETCPDPLGQFERNSNSLYRINLAVKELGDDISHPAIQEVIEDMRACVTQLIKENEILHRRIMAEGVSLLLPPEEREQ